MSILNPKTKHGHPGLLIVIEGTDGSGRSSQINKLREWLAIESYGVMVSEWKTSRLIGRVIDKAKEQNLLNANTFSLMYAADFADRLEHNIIPALRAGLIVLTDRYTYTAFARDVVRGVSPVWVRKLYDFAPTPDLVFYLQTPVDILLKRIISTSGLDYFESGRDIGLSTDFYESFKIYQSRITEEYTKMSSEYDFITLNGNDNIDAIQTAMRENIKALLNTGIIK
ncbi:MAG: dTMP kinase [Candidatus Melainabacteria bacterium GWF2_32_7]|nr:MAG: dTMP kinase [Candidatus Melainabacteria bacterium GWF2_32_7]OGI22780.1 MAG: dTMP kinase [Candidatus Melainabacteria bacterium RIFOXYA2_FULL_32_9]